MECLPWTWRTYAHRETNKQKTHYTRYRHHNPISWQPNIIGFLCSSWKWKWRFKSNMDSTVDIVGLIFIVCVCLFLSLSLCPSLSAFSIRLHSISMPLLLTGIASISVLCRCHLILACTICITRFESNYNNNNRHTKHTICEMIIWPYSKALRVHTPKADEYICI